MYRQSPGRNHRSKRLKMRHVLQICLLLAVCFWLIYQVKHSHDKKKEYDGSDDEKASLERGAGDELLRLGRKDIRPLVEEIDDKTERQHDEASEEDENKLEEEDEENKTKHNVDDVIEGENEETDEHEQEKSDAELDREEEFVDDEKEKEENDDNVTEETNSDPEKHQLEKEDSTEESDSDGVEKSAHEAREEHYKADDASSAVSQATQTKSENEHSKDMLELEDNNNGNDSEDTDKFENGKDLNVETAKDDLKSNVTASENRDIGFDNSKNGSPPNGTMTRVSEDIVARNNSASVAIENLDLSSLNVTASEDNLDHGMSNLNETTSKEVPISDVTASEKMNNSSLHDGNNSLVSNSTSQLETVDEGSNSEHGPENLITSEASTDAANNTEASTEKNDVTEGERSDTSGGTIDENLESTDNENHGEAENDAIDISDSNNPLEEETDARTDLDTLPSIESERTNDDNVDDDGAAAE